MPVCVAHCYVPSMCAVWCVLLPLSLPLTYPLPFLSPRSLLYNVIALPHTLQEYIPINSIPSFWIYWKFLISFSLGATFYLIIPQGLLVPCVCVCLCVPFVFILTTRITLKHCWSLLIYPHLFIPQILFFSICLAKFLHTFLLVGTRCLVKEI